MKRWEKYAFPDTEDRDLWALYAFETDGEKAHRTVIKGGFATREEARAADPEDHVWPQR